MIDGRHREGCAPSLSHLPNLGSETLSAHVGATVGAAELVARLEAFPRRLWLLDYDGTLAPIVARPEDALPEHGALEALIALSRREGDTLAIVSGRSVAQLVSFLGPLTSEKAIFCGLHGGEMVEWPSGKRLLEPDPALRERLKKFEFELLAAMSASQLESRGIALENKSYSLAMHYRNAADESSANEAIAAFHRAATESGALGDFAIRPGKMVLELVPATFDKGSAASILLNSSRDAAGTAAHPVSAGDDLTDEHAFEAILGYDPDATTIRIGKEERPSAARYRLDSPGDTVDLIARIAGLRGS